MQKPLFYNKNKPIPLKKMRRTIPPLIRPHILVYVIYSSKAHANNTFEYKDLCDLWLFIYFLLYTPT